MSSLLTSLRIDYWYKAVLVISTGVLVVALTVPLQGVENEPVALLALGAIFVGLGEWINHPLQERVGLGFKLTGYPRNATPLGIVFDIIGGGLIVWGIVKLF